MLIEIDIPIAAVSMNAYWKPTCRRAHFRKHQKDMRAKMYLSHAARIFKRHVQAAVWEAGSPKFPSDSPLFAVVYAWFRSGAGRRARDGDNIIKPLFDALEKAGVYEDDKVIDGHYLRRMPPCPGGRTKVILFELRTHEVSLQVHEKPTQSPSRATPNPRKSRGLPGK